MSTQPKVTQVLPEPSLAVTAHTLVTIAFDVPVAMGTGVVYLGHSSSACACPR